MEGRQEGEPRCCRRRGCQGSCEGDDLGVAHGCYFVTARYLYHAFQVAIRMAFERKKERGETKEPWITTGSFAGGRLRSVRAQVFVGSKPIQADVKHAQTKLISSPPPFSSLPSSLLSTTTMSDTEGAKKSGYRIEYAGSARAKCKGMSQSHFHSVHLS